MSQYIVYVSLMETFVSLSNLLLPRQYRRNPRLKLENPITRVHVDVDCMLQ